MKLYMGKVWDDDRRLLDVFAIAPNTLFETDKYPGFKYVQIIDDKPVRIFKDKDLIVLEF